MIYAIVAVLALIVDQAVKYWTTVNIVVDTGEAKLIPGLVHLANIHNTGAAFSFLEGARWFFVILCILFCLLVIYVLVKNIVSHRLARWMAVVVMAGAIGNCIDRIVCGYVVDMFEFDFLIFKKPFPVFNIADIYITVGVIVFCVCLFLDKPKAAKTNVPFSEGQAAEEKKEAQRRSPFARRQRTPIPDFPKREHVAEPALDPSDPFAEWEKKNSAIYSQPEKAAPAQPAAQTFEPAPAPAAPAAQTFEPTPAPAAPAPAAPAPQTFGPAPQAFEPTPAPAAPPVTYPAPNAKEQTEADSYNLDDILAEFRDL